MLRLPIENTLDREEKIMAEWQTVRLGEIVKTNQSTYSPKENWQFVNYLDTGNITMNKIDEIQNINTAKDKLPSRARRKVKTNSIIYSTVRPNQLHYGIIKKQPDNFLVSTGFTVIDVNYDKAVPDFIYYALTKQEVTEQLQAIAEQSVSAYPSLKPSDIENLELMLPDKKTQERIVAILRSIDEKIKENNAINNNLEQQTQAIFKSWFVDFELNYGIMPPDWKVSQLGSIAKISTEVFSPAKNPYVEVEHYSIPAYDEKRYPVFETSNGIKSNKYRLSSNSVMISKLNPDTKRIWRPYCISDNPICSTEFIVYEPINPLNRDFIYSIIDSIGFSAFLCSHTTGSTNSRQRATPSITLTYDIVVPDEKTIRAFCSIVSPMYDTIENNIKENQKLAETRDKLLPKLMSGELDISDIDI